MGASGVKLLDDDLAADVRDLFREQLRRGASGRTATNELINLFDDVVGTEEESVFWLALAFVQWEHGLLQQRILKRAVNVIDNGTDLQRWAHDPKLQHERGKVLERLRRKLKSPQTKPKTVRPRKRLAPKCEWQSGDVFSYQLPLGNFLLMRVIEVLDNGGDDMPLCELLDWVGEDVPQESDIVNLPIRRNKRYPSESSFCFPMLKKYLARCRTLGIRTATVLRHDHGYVLPLDFRKLSEDLQEEFGMSVDAFEPQCETGGQQ